MKGQEHFTMNTCLCQLPFTASALPPFRLDAVYFFRTICIMSYLLMHQNNLFFHVSISAHYDIKCYGYQISSSTY